MGAECLASLGTTIINIKGQVGIRAPDPFVKKMRSVFFFRSSTGRGRKSGDHS